MSIIRKVELFDGTNTADIIATNGSYGLVTIQPNHISTDNSTTALLGAGAMFTGNSEDILNYAIMFINVYSDVVSATDGLCIDASSDGINWYQTECYTIVADTYKTFSIQCASKYFRIRYINGGVIQTDFHIEVKLCTKNALDSSHRIADSISDQDDATLNKSVVTAQQPNTNFINIGATESGNLKTTDAENPLAIAKGEVTGSTVDEKFGNAPDFATADGVVNIWDGADNGTAWEQMIYIFSTTDAIDSISSSDAGDTIELTIQGLDISGNEVIQTKNLNGQNRVALDTPLYRVNRAYNSNGTLFVGHVFVYENTALTLGVPTDTTLLRAVVHPENQQTEMCVYTVPNGVTAYMQSVYASTSGANKTSNYVIILQLREENKVFRTAYKTAVSDGATSSFDHNYKVPKKLLQLTDIILTAEMTAVGGNGGSVSGGFEMVLVDNI